MKGQHKASRRGAQTTIGIEIDLMAVTNG